MSVRPRPPGRDGDGTPAVQVQRTLQLRSGAPIPITLWWTGELARVSSLVLVGHGGSGHREDQSTVALAQQICEYPGCAALAIDGPLHGERRSSSDEPDVVTADWRAFWKEDPHVPEMVQDWVVALDWASGEMPRARVAYYGLSMGSLYGTSLVATEPRIRAAVLGMWGGDNVTTEGLAGAARGVAVPVIHYVRWDDERFARETVLRLFEEYASPDRSLLAEPGRHALPERATNVHLLRFLLDRVAQDGSSSHAA